MFSALMTAIAVLGLLTLLSAFVVIPYLCALVVGRILGWALQAKCDTSANELNTVLTKHATGIAFAATSSQRKACHARIAFCRRRLARH